MALIFHGVEVVMNKESFNWIIDSIEKVGEHFEVRIPPSWMQGRASFGGLVGAVAVEAMQRALESPQALRSIQVLFCGPVGTETLHIDTQILRQGRNVTSMRADLIQEGRINCTVLATFGASRDSKVPVHNLESRPSVPQPDTLESFPYVEGLTPLFTQYFDMRWAEGDRPFSECQDKVHGMWTRFKESGPASKNHLIAIADMPPPIVLSMLAQPANGSSLTWMLEFIGDDWQADTSGWWYVKTELSQSSEGYSQQQYTIWAPDGRPVAVGRQMMTVFA